jgi:hypothetical protein
MAERHKPKRCVIVGEAENLLYLGIVERTFHGDVYHV